jgi:hypothetical protein
VNTTRLDDVHSVLLPGFTSPTTGPDASTVRVRIQLIFVVLPDVQFTYHEWTPSDSDAFAVILLAVLLTVDAFVP